MSVGARKPSEAATVAPFLRRWARLLVAVTILALLAGGITVALLSSSSLNSGPGVSGISVTVSLASSCTKSIAGSDGSFTICFDRSAVALPNVSRMFTFAEQRSIGVGGNATCPANGTVGMVLCSTTVMSAGWNTAAGPITVKTTFYSTTGIGSGELAVEFDPSRVY